ncbi:hypothetical protein SDJN03_07797, partial [Cucurbita argyrosperma subsp. sororia]
MAYEIQGEESRGGEDTAEITYGRKKPLLIADAPEPLWPPSRKGNAGWVKLGSEEWLKNGRLETEAHIHEEQEDLKVAQESIAAKLVWSMRNQYK